MYKISRNFTHKYMRFNLLIFHSQNIFQNIIRQNGLMNEKIKSKLT